MTVRQIHLSQGNRRLTCWVEDRAGVRAGNSLTLKGETGRWRIETVGNMTLDKAHLNTKWAVGGLL